MDLKDVRVLLIEATDHLMGNYPDELRKATVDLLQGKQVEVLLNTKLSDYNGRQVTLGDGTQINAHTLIWTAGVSRGRFNRPAWGPAGSWRTGTRRAGFAAASAS